MEEATIIDLLEAMKTHPAFNLIRNDLVGNSSDLDIALDKAIDCLKQEAMHMEKPFITECRDIAIEKNLPLYFVYYEETGVFEVYITATQELFEKRHCSKRLSYAEFDDIATRYLDEYLAWGGGEE